MVRFVACDGVVVISANARLRTRAVALLDHMGMNLLEFLSIDELRRHPFHGYAVVLIENDLNSDTVKKLRTLRHCAMLILVCKKDNEVAVTSAFYSGADFYFDITDSDTLITASLHAALRSCDGKRYSNIVAPPYNFDVQRRQVFLNNQCIALKPIEYKLAEYFFRRPEEVVARTELMRSVWTLPLLEDSRRIDTAASNIRRKMQLGQNLSGWELQNIRGVGFKLSSATLNELRCGW